MAIKILTYSNPYKLNKEDYWDKIKNSVYICSSQTLVNGLIANYADELGHNDTTTTIANFIKYFYSDWTDKNKVIEQMAIVDQIIIGNLYNEYENKIQIIKTFRRNREDVINSLRTLFELDVKPDDIQINIIKSDQKYFVKLYRYLYENNIREFNFDNQLTKDIVEDRIENVLEFLNQENQNFNVDSYNLDTVVIHGIHQFKPLHLKFVEELSKYKDVILLFNYNSQFAKIYQTWIDIYNSFDIKIDFSEYAYAPTVDKNKKSYLSNMLGTYLNETINGSFANITETLNIEMLEFDNRTEFADYVAFKFIEGKKQIDEKKSSIVNMREQFYCADKGVNDILKVYFPEQFGERQFLDYPAGRFILELSNMWSIEDNKLEIEYISQIKECLVSGMFYEEKQGQLIEIFSNCQTVFENCGSVEECIERIRTIREKKVSDEDNIDEMKHLSYCNILDTDIQKLEFALLDLQSIANNLFNNFESQNHNIKTFYRKIVDLYKTRIIKSSRFTKEFIAITKDIVEGLNSVDHLTLSTSLDCLKSTFGIYLVQSTILENTAKWIVRDFEQLEGDILRTKFDTRNTVYHFGGLSNNDISSKLNKPFSWPLDSDFFEIAQDPIDWKYQVFVNSSKEYKNYKKYALVYALIYNYCDVKISYIKNSNNQENEMLYLFEILGIDKKEYKEFLTKAEANESVKIVSKPSIKKFSLMDYYKYKQCPYKFLLESIVEETTLYKDSFLQMLYLEIALEYLIKEKMDNQLSDLDVLDSICSDCIEMVKPYYPQLVDYIFYDAVKSVKNSIDLDLDWTYTFTNEDKSNLIIKLSFLRNKLRDPKNRNGNIFAKIFEEIDDKQIYSELSEEKFDNLTFDKKTKEWCKYCSNREICLEFYK